MGNLWSADGERPGGGGLRAREPAGTTRGLLRGDDVATLPRLLEALGFDAGRVDGIFGPDAAAVPSDFHRNVGIAVDDRILGPKP